MCTARLPVVDWTDAPAHFNGLNPFRRKTKSGFCACVITFQTQATADNFPTLKYLKLLEPLGPVQACAAISLPLPLLTYCMLSTTKMSAACVFQYNVYEFAHHPYWDAYWTSAVFSYFWILQSSTPSVISEDMFLCTKHPFTDTSAPCQPITYILQLHPSAFSYLCRVRMGNFITTAEYYSRSALDIACRPGWLSRYSYSLWLDRRDIESRWGWDFSQPRRPALGLTQPPM